MSGMADYTVTVSDWTQPRGYKNSGRGWRVRCFSTAKDGWNDLGHTVSEQYFKTEAKARREAAALAKTYNAKLFD